MRITYAKFFQPVQVYKDKNDAMDVTNYLKDKDYNLVLDGQFIKVQPKNGGKVTYVTVFNTCFLRTDAHDDITLIAPPAPSSKASSKPQTKQD